MSYPLTINRVMGICAFEGVPAAAAVPTPQEAREIAKRFYRQMRAMSQDRLGDIYAAVVDAGAGLDVVLTEKPQPDDELDLTVIQGDSANRDYDQLFTATPDSGAAMDAQNPIVGLFRARRYTMVLDGRPWDVRLRLSVTGCVYEQRDRLTKLWVSFEGVPEGDVNTTNEQESLRFISVTTAMAEAIMPQLRDAYRDGFAAVTPEVPLTYRMEDRRLQVSLADNTDPSFSRLVDKMNLGGVLFEEAARVEGDDKLRAGADEVVTFVEAVSGARVDPAKINLKRGAGGLVAVYAWPIAAGRADHGPIRLVIAGLASSIGMISNSRVLNPEWKGLETTPDLLRSISAARPLSARIADNGARQLEMAIAEPA